MSCTQDLKVFDSNPTWHLGKLRNPSSSLASIYLLKVNNRNTRTRNTFKVNNKDTGTTPVTWFLVLVSLLLTLNIFNILL